MRRRIGFILCMGLVLLLSSGVVSAQSRSVFWHRWDVTISDIDTENNEFTVIEAYDLTFTGSFTFGSVVIPYNNLENIRNVQVMDEGRALTSSCSGGRGTYCAERTDEGYSITYYFSSPVSNSSRKVQIKYDVIGALRVYEGGDQLWWIAVPDEHFGFAIGESTITVVLPDGFAPREGVDPVETYGVSSTVQINGTRVVATATEQITGNQSFEIRVQYPHDPNARVTSWQAAFDRQREFDENVRPLLDIGFIAISLLIAVGGVLFVYIRYQTKGRDPDVGPVPTFLTEPPSDLRPAVVGSLVDEKVDLRDIMSTLIDLAHRGYVVIEETQNEGLFGLGSTSEFSFKRTDKAITDLQSYEQRLMDKVFRGNLERTLNSMRNTFYSALPELKSDLYNQLVSEGFMASNPEGVRNMWAGFGVFAVIGSFVAGIVAANFIESVSFALICIPAAFGVLGLAMLVISQAMPVKTRKGAEEAAKWKAFQEYLQNMDKYQDLEEAAKHFDEYLPYAVAFGIDRSWIRRFSQLSNVPVPVWYFPTYMGGPYGRGYMAGSPIYRSGGDGGGMGLPGELARAGDGGFSLDNMSGNLAGGLESMSNGLTNMLDSASRVMTSQPQSSGSGGRGGFSGGGFSGGGGSGGGSRGFG